MRLGYLSALFPFAYREQFFEAEVTSLAQYFSVTTFETRASTAKNCYPDVPGTAVFLGLFGPRVFALALKEWLRAPGAVLGVLWFLLTAPCALRGRIVNVILFPKALAFARTLRAMGIEHVHVNWMTTTATLAFVARRLSGVPYSITAHQHDIFSNNLIAAKVREAEFVRVISERNCRHLQDQLPPELRSKCSVLHVGVKLPAGEAPREVLRPGPSRIICAARLCSWKGHRYLIEALGALERRGFDFTCDFAGEDELHGEVQRLVAESGLGPKINLLGPVPHAQLVRALERGDYDLGVLASTEDGDEHEGIPVALMEAMAVGLPVVATRTGSVSELVDASCGILVEQRDPAALGEALGTLLADATLRKRLGAEGRRRVFAGFETAEITRRLATLLVRSAPWHGADCSTLGQKSLAGDR